MQYPNCLLHTDTIVDHICLAQDCPQRFSCLQCLENNENHLKTHKHQPLKDYILNPLPINTDSVIVREYFINEVGIKNKVQEMVSLKQLTLQSLVNEIQSVFLQEIEKIYQQETINLQMTIKELQLYFENSSKSIIEFQNFNHKYLQGNLQGNPILLVVDNLIKIQNTFDFSILMNYLNQIDLLNKELKLKDFNNLHRILDQTRSIFNSNSLLIKPLEFSFVNPVINNQEAKQVVNFDPLGKFLEQPQQQGQVVPLFEKFELSHNEISLISVCNQSKMMGVFMNTTQQIFLYETQESLNYLGKTIKMLQIKDFAFVNHNMIATLQSPVIKFYNITSKNFQESYVTMDQKNEILYIKTISQGVVLLFIKNNNGFWIEILNKTRNSLLKAQIGIDEFITKDRIHPIADNLIGILQNNNLLSLCYLENFTFVEKHVHQTEFEISHVKGLRVDKIIFLAGQNKIEIFDHTLKKTMRIIKLDNNINLNHVLFEVCWIGNRYNIVHGRDQLLIGDFDEQNDSIRVVNSNIHLNNVNQIVNLNNRSMVAIIAPKSIICYNFK